MTRNLQCFEQKFLKLTPKMKEISNFQKIYAFFSEFSTDVADWNVEKDQKGENVLSSMLIKEINTVFQTKTVEN